MLRRRLDPERHGGAGYTSVIRVAAIGFVAAFLAVGVHLAMQAWYEGRVLPGVAVGGRDVGGLSLAQLRQQVRQEADGYRLSLVVAGQHYEADASELGVTFDPETTVESAYRSGREAWLPPLHEDPIPLSYQLSRTQLNAFVASVADKVGVAPVDAGVVVHGTQPETVPDKSGWSIDRQGLERLVEADVRSPGGATLRLQPRTQAADIQAGALGSTIAEAKQLMAVPVILSYNDKTFTPTPSDIGQWLAFTKQADGTTYKLVPQVDTAKLKSYVQSVANQIDTAPVPKKVTIENGVTRVDQEGQNGLAVDQDPLTAAIAEAVTKQTPLTYTVTTHPVTFKTISNTVITLDYGRYIEINLSTQHLWVWQDHNVIYESPVTSGATGAGFPTATGLFSIYYKTTNTHLVGNQYGPRYNYDVFVQYWMPFYQGFGLHDASWRNGNFGGQDYYYGGSHGCVNLPLATAAFLYGWADIGTPVWVHN